MDLSTKKIINSSYCVLELINPSGPRNEEIFLQQAQGSTWVLRFMGYKMRMLDGIEKFKEWRQYKVGKFTLKGYDGQLRQLCIFLRNPQIEEITYEQVMEWMILNEKVGYSMNAMLPKCEALKQFLKFFKKFGYKVMEPDLVPVPRKEYVKARVATELEFRTLLLASVKVEEIAIERKHLDDQLSVWRNRTLVMMLWDTGARIGELLSLTTKDIDMNKKKAYIRTEKSRGRRPFREIFWTSATNNHLKKWLEGKTGFFKDTEHDKEAIFIGIKSRHRGLRIGNSAVHAFLKYWSEVGELKRTVNAHSFRHHKGHDIINKGGSAADVTNILGHVNIASSQVYMMMNDKELQNRADKFLDEQA